jgi:hypothetical protein
VRFAQTDLPGSAIFEGELLYDEKKASLEACAPGFSLLENAERDVLDQTSQAT